MIKKLYSRRAKEKNKMIFKGINNEDISQKQQEVKETIESRQVFRFLYY